MAGKESELPIDVLKKELSELKETVDAQARLLEAYKGALDAQLESFDKFKGHVKEFVSRFGRYHSVAGHDAGMFIVHQVTNAGVRGCAISPQQGLVQDLILPMSSSADSRDKRLFPDVVNVGQGVFIPAILDWEREDEVEEFSANGADS